jgi:hypothetical protein
MDISHDTCLPWCEQIEALLCKWSSSCCARAVIHARLAEKKKRMFRAISIPAIILPIAMASFSQLYSACNDYEAQLVNSIGYLITGSLAGVGAFLNYGNQYAQHAQYEILYEELHTEIECILAKPPIYRTRADVILVDIRLKYDALNKGSPDT